jgi:dTDP-4-amino-4,6-dideoxygalactose transaminase
MIVFHKHTKKYEDSIVEDVGKSIGNYQTEFLGSFLTKSCTQSLELAILCLNLEAGSEVILPSFGFVSLANAVSNFGYSPVFVDCQADTMNVCPTALEEAINEKTKAVITINYSGVSCEYDQIIPICKKYGLVLIEDNAHGIFSKYKGGNLGTFGDISTFSFDHLKIISCYEGGSVKINQQRFLEAFQIVAEFGTNRKAYMENKSDFYEWKFKGSNSKLAEPLLRILATQLENAPLIVSEFKRKWATYHNSFDFFEKKGWLTRMVVPDSCEHNGYMYWFKANSAKERTALMTFLKQENIQTAFHYTPLHKSEYGSKVGRFHGEDKNTTLESQKLLRLPHYFDLSDEDQQVVIEKVAKFYNS